MNVVTIPAMERRAPLPVAMRQALTKPDQPRAIRGLLRHRFADRPHLHEQRILRHFRRRGT
jgi:hypothetical protein